METLIFDKSFVQSLNPDELFELDVFFELVNTPILRKEILADLEKKSTEERKQLSIVKSLCAKMSRSGLEPMEYRSAALHDLNTGRAIPLHGAILIDASAPHVRVGVGGGIHYDGRDFNGTGDDGQKVLSPMKNDLLQHRTDVRWKNMILKLHLDSGGQEQNNTSGIARISVSSSQKSMP